MAKAAKRRPSLSSSNPDPEEKLMKLLEEEEEEEAAPFNIGIEAIIQHQLQTLNQSYNRIQNLLQTTSLIQSYKRLGKIHEVENDHVVFDQSSDALQKDIESSIQVAQNITNIFKSILPRHTLDYVSDNKNFFLANFSKSEDLKVSKFQKKTVFVRNKIVDLAVKLYNLTSSRIKRSIAESVQYGQFRKYGTMKSVSSIERDLYLWGKYHSMKEEEMAILTWRDEIMMKIREAVKDVEMVITERDEIMMKIEKAMKDLEGILFGIYVMLQTQVAISAYAAAAASISDDDDKYPQWFGTGHHKDIKSLAAAETKKDIESLAAAETKKKTKKKTTTFSMQWFKSKIISFYCCLH